MWDIYPRLSGSDNGDGALPSCCVSTHIVSSWEWSIMLTWIVVCCSRSSSSIVVIHCDGYACNNGRKEESWRGSCSKLPLWDISITSRIIQIRPKSIQTVQNLNIWIIIGLCNGIMMTHRVYTDIINDKSKDSPRNYDVLPVQESREW